MVNIKFSLGQMPNAKCNLINLIFFPVLRPYKYAGYPQLIKTIRLETKDDELFSKQSQLLTAASELCFYTVHCSALNAEELRREEGIEALLEAYDRCVSILGADTKPDSLHYRVISNVTQCFEVACHFDKCKEKIISLPRLISNVCRVLYFKHTLSVSLVTSLAANNFDLQCNLICNGVLWSLLYFCFEYDYTLDESGVEVSDRTNQQQQANSLAKMSILACIALAGFGLQLRSTPDAVKHQQTNSPYSSKSNLQNDISDQIKAKEANEASLTAYTKNAQNPLQCKQFTDGTGSTGKPSLAVATRGSTVLNNDRNSSSSSNGRISNETNSLSNNKDLDLLRHKYHVTAEAQNKVVKQILNRLLTKYIVNKLTKERDSEVTLTTKDRSNCLYLL